ncbi:hypothetical protein E2C01_025967 [Portunus trituberculatus]|uniref:Uncharacterized protein n=1 Tax=Portunus trituberculatus TaxID=210409 RepID=A0A5B7EJE3_PORTR|nr:hypothetical protein [Portunus trituberculatus]
MPTRIAMEVVRCLAPQAALPRHQQRLLPAGVPVKGHAAFPNGTVKECLVIWRPCQTTSVICIRHLVLLSDLAAPRRHLLRPPAPGRTPRHSGLTLFAAQMMSLCAPVRPPVLASRRPVPHRLQSCSSPGTAGTTCHDLRVYDHVQYTEGADFPSRIPSPKLGGRRLEAKAELIIAGKSSAPTTPSALHRASPLPTIKAETKSEGRRLRGVEE